MCTGGRKWRCVKGETDAICSSVVQNKGGVSSKHKRANLGVRFLQVTPTHMDPLPIVSPSFIRRGIAACPGYASSLELTIWLRAARRAANTVCRNQNVLTDAKYWPYGAARPALR